MRHHPVQVAAATTAGEQILQTIFGDDLEGCSISLDALVTIIERAIHTVMICEAELLSLHESATEAFQLLSTPPPTGVALSVEALNCVLAERLDAIHTISKKLSAADAAARAQLAIISP